MPRFRRLFASSAVLALAFLPACQTPSGGEPPRSAAATRQADLEAELTTAVASHDGATQRRVARELRQEGRAAPAAAALLRRLAPEASPPLSLADARSTAELYLLLPDASPSRLFALVVASPQMERRRLAWQVAAEYPSDAMASAVAAVVSRRAEQASQSGKGTGLSPEAALAIRANGLAEAYPLVRAALMAEGQPAYAKALIDLRPAAAADDLMAYLAEARLDDLLAGRPAGVNRTTCLVALGHLAEHPPSLHQPSVKALFYYAAAHDPALARAGAAVVARLAAAGPADVAFLLAQMPGQVRTGVAAHLRQAGVSKPLLARLMSGD